MFFNEQKRDTKKSQKMILSIKMYVCISHPSLKVGKINSKVPQNYNFPIEIEVKKYHINFFGGNNNKTSFISG